MMAESWHACIEDELVQVEGVIQKSLQTRSPELTEMCTYVTGSGGKRLRPAICLLSYHACGGEDPTRPIQIGAAFEIVHSATLIHDDINDQGELRRGRKTLHKQYTVSKAIIAGDYMFAVGFRLLSAVANEIVDFIVEASAYMGVGEFIQKDFEHSPDVKQEDYIRIIEGKTAKLFEASAKSGAVITDITSEALDALGDYAYCLGLGFQIVDDMLDVKGDPHNTGKSVGTDLLEGKPTLPVIYAMQDKVHGPRIKELFMKPEVTNEDVVEALKLIQMTDSVSRCMDLAKEFIGKAKDALAPIPDSRYKTAMLNLADFVVSRDR
jgi:octaprenyl-diphosphate synthase